MTDPTRAVWNILTNGAPLPPKPNTLPTEPGLYIVDQPKHHDLDHWWIDSADIRRSRGGSWSIDKQSIEDADLLAFLGTRTLVQLIPITEADVH